MRKTFRAILLSALKLFGCREDIETHAKVLGMTQQEVLAEYGEPSGSATFTLTDTLHEYQYSLLVIHPEPDGKNIRIRELLWKFPDHRQLVIWLEQQGATWRVIDNVEWDTDRLVF